MRKRIAIIFDSDINSPRGKFNAIQNRIVHLREKADYDIDVFVLSPYEPWYIRQLRHTNKVDRVEMIEMGGITCHVKWYYFTLVDYLLEVKLHRLPVFRGLFYRWLANRIHGYDLISAHSSNCGLLASRISKRDNIPYCVTWHGSDIHTEPFSNKPKLKIVKNVLNSAAYNFFVSEDLQRIGYSIAPSMCSTLLYNGKDESFCRFSDLKRCALRDKYGVPQNAKVVSYVGGIIEVKNPHLLAPIFSAVKNQYSEPLVFWIIGSGKLQKEVEDSCAKMGINCVFWGNQPPSNMPLFMNCMDVLVLPSRNEGLPLVAVEAIACGANVVGSDVGGISEAIGKDNVFPHGTRFIKDFSDRIVYMLKNKVEQPLGSVFDWQNTAIKENAIYQELIK